LPPEFMMQWMNWVENMQSRKRDLVYFNQWLDSQTTLACRFCPPTSNLEQKSLEIVEPSLKSKRRVRFKTELKQEETPSTAAGLFVGEKSNWKKPQGDRPVKSCIFCGNSHNNVDCVKAYDMTLAERKSKVEESRCCFFCINPTHLAKNCQKFVRCPCCSAHLVLLMCPEFKRKVQENKETVK